MTPLLLAPLSPLAIFAGCVLAILGAVAVVYALLAATASDEEQGDVTWRGRG